MTTDETFELEQRIQDLLCGELAPAERDELLLLIARDDEARRTLREMLIVQQATRAAWGLDRGQPAMDASRTRVIGRLRTGDRPRADETPRRPAGAGLSGLRPPRLLRTAAVFVIAMMVVIGALLYQDYRAAQRRLASVQEVAAASEVSVAEKQGYLHLWKKVAEGATDGLPWVSFSGGEGEFGYLPAGPKGDGQERLVLVRCLLATVDGRVVKTINLLLPSRRSMQLSLPDIDRLAGRPVGCDVAIDQMHAAIGLRVGDESAGTAGVTGTVPIGKQPVEIGQLRINGQGLRVVVQVVGLNGAVG